MFPGDHVGSPLRVSVCPFRNSRHSAKGFSARHSRALDETSCFRATTWGRPYGGRTGHPRITNICKASRRYSRSICPVFVGATLRGRPSMGKISFQCRPRRHATNFVHFAVLLLMTGFSFIPQKFCFCGILPCKARHIVHISRT